MKSLQTLPRTNLFLPETNEGEACLAARDGFVYRCKIIEKQSGAAIVKFVDFGDEACVPEIDLYQIDAEFLRFPEQAIRCSLDGAEAKFHSPDKVCKVLNSFASSRAFIARVVGKSTVYYVLELIDERGVKLIDLVDDVVARAARAAVAAPAKMVIPPADVTVGSSETIYVLEILSNTSFFGQLCKYSSADVDQLQADLQRVYSKPQPALQSVAAGDFCVTRFSQDNEFYRAKVLRTDGSRCEVALVDFGAEEHKRLSELLPLTPELCRTRVFGVACSLADAYWPLPDDAMQALHETEFTVVLDKQLSSGFSVHVPDTPDNRVTTARLARQVLFCTVVSFSTSPVHALRKY